MEHGSTEWYTKMADLMKGREHAQQMIDRWAGKLAAMESEILALTQGTEAAEPHES